MVSGDRVAGALPILLVTAVVLTLGSFPTLQALKLQQLTLLVAGLLSGGMALLVAGHLFAAGAMLAVASIKPQLVVPITACLLLWALSDWRRRQGFVWGFASTMAFAGSPDPNFCCPGGLGTSLWRCATTEIMRVACRCWTCC